MCIITSVTRCSSYFLYLAGIGLWSFQVSTPRAHSGFLGDNAIYLALCPQASGGLNWVPMYGGGFCRKGSSVDGDTYAVSFEMQECRKKKRFWFR